MLIVFGVEQSYLKQVHFINLKTYTNCKSYGVKWAFAMEIIFL